MARMFNPPLALRLDVARRCVARIGTGASRTHAQARLSAPDLFGGGLRHWFLLQMKRRFMVGGKII